MRRYLLVLYVLFVSAALATDAQPRLSRADFDSAVSRGIALLKDEFPLSVEDAILLVRIANTFSVLEHQKFSDDVSVGNKDGYREDSTLSLPQGGSITALVPIVRKTKSEEEFEQLLWRRESFNRLVRALGENIPNKGMGTFFKAHDLHWGGSIGNIRDRDQILIADDGPKGVPNQALEPTSTAVTPPASAGDRASGTRGSP